MTQQEPQKKQKQLKQIEVEDWFVRNYRAMEAKKQMDNKDFIKKQSRFHDNMIKHQAKVEEIDPIFCKAYGVEYDEKRAKEIFFSSAKTEQLDNEYTEYMENRPETPSEEAKEKKRE